MITEAFLLPEPPVAVDWRRKPVVLDESGVRFLDVESGPVVDIPLACGPVADVHCMSDTMVAVAGGLCAIVDERVPKQVTALGYGGCSSRLMCVTSDGSNFLSTGTSDGHLVQYDMRTFKEPITHKAVHQAAVTSVVGFSEVASAGLDGAVAILGYVDARGDRRGMHEGNYEVALR